MTPERRREIEQVAQGYSEHRFGDRTVLAAIIINELLAEIDEQAKQIDRLWGRIDELEKQIRTLTNQDR